MDNQHRKITGYRELNQEEIDLMNKVKALGPQIEGVLLEIQAFLKKQADDANAYLGTEAENDEVAKKVIDRRANATPERFWALAKTELQTGLMYATRAVAQPEFF